MIVIRQSTLRTSIATGVLVVAFASMGIYGLLRFDPGRGHTTAIALLIAAALLGAVSVRSLLRGAIVAVLRSSGLELRSSHFARWGVITWEDIAEVFLFRSVGLQMIGLRLVDPQRYLRRSSPWARSSLWVDRQLAAGADAYLPASAARAQTTDLARLMRVFQNSDAVREHFGRDDLVLEFPTDVSLADVLKVTTDQAPAS